MALRKRKRFNADKAMKKIHRAVNLAQKVERERCVKIVRFAEKQATTPVAKGIAFAIAEALENDALT